MAECIQRSLALPSRPLKKGFQQTHVAVSLFSRVFVFLLIWSHTLFLHGDQILGLLPFYFKRKLRAFCPPLWSAIVRVSDWTNDVFSHSFAFLIGGLCISYEFYADLFSCVNLSMYEIKVYSFWMRVWTVGAFVLRVNNVKRLDSIRWLLGFYLLQRKVAFSREGRLIQICASWEGVCRRGGLIEY